MEVQFFSPAPAIVPTYAIFNGQMLERGIMFPIKLFRFRSDYENITRQNKLKTSFLNQSPKFN